MLELLEVFDGLQRCADFSVSIRHGKKNAGGCVRSLQVCAFFRHFGYMTYSVARFMGTIGLLSRSMDEMQKLVKRTISSVGAKDDNKLVSTLSRAIDGYGSFNEQ